MDRDEILARLQRIREVNEDREPAMDTAIREGLSDQEIATALGVAHTTVWRRRQRLAAGEA